MIAGNDFEEIQSKRTVFQQLQKCHTYPQYERYFGVFILCGDTYYLGRELQGKNLLVTISTVKTPWKIVFGVKLF